ncbi:MAG: monovalent cation/H(+) antiporter subunit G [Flavobacteriaceae bacterium]|jgi:multicomponent Na+:H+ antiporter subunit G|nr:monovalent cation/H(+) antiporter subunit G [Flavobacteriaceae bacterium]
MNDIIIMVFCTLGAIFILIASLGIYRMPDFYTRLSVTVKAGTLGVGCILGAVAYYFYDFAVSTKVFAIIFFLFITSPVAAFMISRTAYVSGIKLWKTTYVDKEADLGLGEEDIPEND